MARVALETVKAELPNLKSVRRVRFVLYDESGALLHARVLAEVMGDVSPES